MLSYISQKNLLSSSLLILSVCFSSYEAKSMDEEDKKNISRAGKGQKKTISTFVNPYKEYWEIFLPEMAESFRVYNDHKKSGIVKTDHEILEILFGKLEKGQFPDRRTAEQKFSELAKGNRPYAKLFNPPEKALTYEEYWQIFLPEMAESFRVYNGHKKSGIVKTDREILEILFGKLEKGQFPDRRTAEQKFSELAKRNRPYAKLFNPPEKALSYKEYWQIFLPEMAESFRVYNGHKKSGIVKTDHEILEILFGKLEKGQFPDRRTAGQKFSELAKGNRPYAKLFNLPEEIEDDQHISISHNIIPKGPLVSFYLNETKTPSHLTINDIHKASWDVLEKQHDYIQLLFPLREASSAIKSAPILTKDGPEERQFRENTYLQNMLKKSFLLMLDFYGLKYDQKFNTVTKNDYFEKRAGIWLKQGNHNHLRITRILKSLRILGLNDYAQAFFNCLNSLYHEENNKNFSKISQASFGFWQNVVQDKLLNISVKDQLEKAPTSLSSAYSLFSKVIGRQLKWEDWDVMKDSFRKEISERVTEVCANISYEDKQVDENAKKFQFWKDIESDIVTTVNMNKLDILVLRDNQKDVFVKQFYNQLKNTIFRGIVDGKKPATLENWTKIAREIEENISKNTVKIYLDLCNLRINHINYLYNIIKAHFQDLVDNKRATWRDWDYIKNSVHTLIDREVYLIWKSQKSTINNNHNFLNQNIQKSVSKTNPQIQKFNEIKTTLLKSKWSDKITIDLNELHKNDYISGFGTAQKGFDQPQIDNNGYAWLSNYYEANSLNPNSTLTVDFSIKVKIKGQIITFKSVETAYQLYKLYSYDRNSNIDPKAFSTKKPNDARISASHIKKYNYSGGDKFMNALLHQKFINHSVLKNALIQTSNMLLFETNAWGDQNWGMVHNLQQNTITGSGKLGKMIMGIRENIQNTNIGPIDIIDIEKFL